MANNFDAILVFQLETTIQVYIWVAIHYFSEFIAVEFVKFVESDLDSMIQEENNSIGENAVENKLSEVSTADPSYGLDPSGVLELRQMYNCRANRISKRAAPTGMGELTLKISLH